MLTKLVQDMGELSQLHSHFQAKYSLAKNALEPREHSSKHHYSLLVLQVFDLCSFLRAHILQNVQGVKGNLE